MSDGGRATPPTCGSTSGETCGKQVRLLHAPLADRVERTTAARYGEDSAHNRNGNVSPLSPRVRDVRAGLYQGWGRHDALLHLGQRGGD